MTMTMTTIAIIATTAIIMIVLSETAPATNTVVNLLFSVCTWRNTFKTWATRWH